MTRFVPAALLILLALALPAQAAAKPALTIKTPNAGDLTIAHVVIDTKGATGAPKLPLANKSKLSKQVTIAGGVKKLKKNRFLASIVVARKTPGSAGKPPAFNLVAPKGVKSWKLSTQFARNLLGSNLSPKFCSAAPASFGYVSKKPLAGSAVPRFATQELVNAAYSLDCPAGYDEFETRNLQAALRGEPQPSAQPPGGGDGGEGGEDEEGDEGGGIPTSSMQVTGTVVDEGGGVFRYEMSFNEPVSDFKVEAARASVECPNQYNQAACGSFNSASAGSTTLTCIGGDFTYEFACRTPGTRSRGTAPPTVPAGTPIVGRFKINAGSISSGSVKVSGFGPGGQGQPQALSGP